MIRVTPNLSEQQVCFCDEYLVSFNAYRSAISAGYSENTARKGELLHYPKIQEYLRMKMQQRSERMEITHDMILREYAKIAFSNMANYYDTRGDVKPVCELTETEMAAISYFQTVNIAEPDGYKVGMVTKIKLHNKMAALDKIAKHLGFFGVKGESLKEKGFVEQVEEAASAAAVEDEAVEEVAGNERTENEGYTAAEENEDGYLIDRAKKEGGKILTFSPLITVAANEDGCATENATDGFMEELLLRGTDD